MDDDESDLREQYTELFAEFENATRELEIELNEATEIADNTRKELNGWKLKYEDQQKKNEDMCRISLSREITLQESNEKYRKTLEATRALATKLENAVTNTEKRHRIDLELLADHDAELVEITEENEFLSNELEDLEMFLQCIQAENKTLKDMIRTSNDQVDASRKEIKEIEQDDIKNNKLHKIEHIQTCEKQQAKITSIPEISESELTFDEGKLESQIKQMQLSLSHQRQKIKDDEQKLHETRTEEKKMAMQLKKLTENLRKMRNKNIQEKHNMNYIHISKHHSSKDPISKISENTIQSDNPHTRLLYLEHILQDKIKHSQERKLLSANLGKLRQQRQERRIQRKQTSTKSDLRKLRIEEKKTRQALMKKYHENLKKQMDFQPWQRPPRRKQTSQNALLAEQHY